MIVDLAGSGFELLRLHITIEAANDKVKKSWESAGLDPGHQAGDGFHYMELAGFRKHGRQYLVALRLTTSGKDSTHMTVDYTSGEVSRPRVRRANLSKLGQVLDGLPISCSVACLASGDFPPDRFRTIIGLPFLRFDMPNQFFDEVRGVRLAKLSDGAESHSVTLDMHEEDELHVHARTDYTTILSASVPSDALARLTNLRDHAVTEVRSDLGGRA